MSLPQRIDYALSQFSAPRSSKVLWQPNPARAALLIHDMQDYFLRCFPEDCALYRQLLAHIDAVRESATQNGVPVFYTAQPPATRQERGLLFDMWGPGLAAVPEAAAIASRLAPREGDEIIDKHRYSAFHRTSLRERLRALGRDQLWICGVYAHIGCMITACDAFMHDIQPFVIADALADFSVQRHQQALDYVAERCGVVITVAELLHHLPIANRRVSEYRANP